MNALDTNVIVRHLLQDTPSQAAVAADLLQGSCYLSHTVLMEAVWVLRSSGRLPREVVAAAMQRLIDLPTVRINDEPAVRWAVGRFAQAGDFSDLMHVATANGASAFVTFDRKLARDAGADAPVGVKTLAPLS